MSPRGTIIAALLVIELAIIGEAISLIRGSHDARSSSESTAALVAFGPRLLEGGPHQTFEAGAHPALTVDIGYADLTILASNASQIEVSVSKSTDFGFMNAKEPITARKDGETIRITKPEEPGWSMGDDRMVTVLVPAETQVTVVNGGDIRANGLHASASFNSVGNGSVTIDDYDAPVLHVESGGRIVLHRIVAARLEATSSDGHVEGAALQVRDGSIESSGRVSLGFATGADTLVTAETDNGRVRISGFAAGATGATERKSSDDSDDADSSSQTVRVGAGNGRLEIHSSDGNINLTQES